MDQDKIQAAKQALAEVFIAHGLPVTIVAACDVFLVAAGMARSAVREAIVKSLEATVLEINKLPGGDLPGG